MGWLGKHLGMFSDRLDVTLFDARAAEMAQAYGLNPAELEQVKRDAMKLLAPPKQLR